MNADYRTIKERPPIERFAYYIGERYQIALRRASGQRRPWTHDPILQLYKFTNVKRSWDYVSRWLWQYWYQPHRESRSVGIACAVARFTNYVPTFEALGYPKTVAFDYWREKLKLHRAQHGKVFGAAYHIVGGIETGSDKIDWLVDHWIRDVWKTNLLIRWWPDPFELHRELTMLNGWGNFMAQEVVLDWMLTHFADGVSDNARKRFAVPGPGGRRGLNRVLDQAINLHYNDESALEALRDVHLTLLPYLPAALKKDWTRHDTQFNLCEFDKYERTLWNQGQPRATYQPRPDSEQIPLALTDLPIGAAADLRRVGHTRRSVEPKSRGTEQGEG
jgi:hypothetical protein